MAMIQMESVEKIYRGPAGLVRVLRCIDLKIARGEFVAVMGPSGSGKSTLLSLLGLLSEPTKGRIALDGEQTVGLSERARTRIRAERIGFVFQFPSLVSTLDVRENVLLPLTLTGRTDAKYRRRADDLLAGVGLMGRGADRTYQLSGGEQRKVALARALLLDPPLVLADEPTGALDCDSAQEMMNLLRCLSDRGRTVVMVTHDRELAGQADRVLMLRDGVMGT
jgi:ABC-type lipoprotein export system ATPase subunit